MGELKVRKVPAVTINSIDRLAREKNVSREQFLRDKLEKIIIDDENSKQETKVELLLKKENELLRENYVALNVIAQYFITGDEEAIQKGLKLLGKISKKEIR